MRLKPCPWCKAVPRPNERQGGITYDEYIVPHERWCFLKTRVNFVRAELFKSWNQRTKPAPNIVQPTGTP